MAGPKRPTGTVPKTRKNLVPQEMVAPTRRDLQEHLNEFFASVAERAAKPKNNQTGSVSENCFDLDNLSLQENTRYWPVRPIPRRNFHDDNNMNDQHLSNQSVGGSNTTIGVVIPTTPSSSVLQQYNDHSHQQPHINNHHRQRINRTPDSIGAVVTENNSSVNRASALVENPAQQLTGESSAITNSAAANVEERINQIQEYIRITSTLINSIQAEKPSPGNTEDISVLTKNLDNLRDSEQKLLEIKQSDEYKTLMDNRIKIPSSINGNNEILNSASLENVCSPTESNGPRPQSVASLYTSTPNTPTYEELQAKLEFSNRNMLNIKEQQQQLLRLQHTAKQQLQEMEQIREQHGPMSFAGNTQGMPDYDNAEDVQNDVETLMTRMKTLNDFIRNQNELASLLGADKNEVLEEQMQLQQKLTELKNKKQQMANLVNELQQMNGEIVPNGTTSVVNEPIKNQTKPQPDSSLLVQNVPIDYERIVPIEMVQNQRAFSTPRYSTPLLNNRQKVDSKRELEPARNDAVRQLQQQQQNIDHDVDDDNEHNANNNDDDDDEEEGATGNDIQENGITEKIAEINAMKNQLKRLQDMMATVKLIELKNDTADSTRSSRSPSHFESSPAVAVAASIQKSSMDAESYTLTNDRQPSVPKSVNNLNVVTGTAHHAHDDKQDEDIEIVGEEELEMNERVRALNSMTQDLRLQAISLAAERDRLKDIKNEMFRRREIEADKNSSTKREVNVCLATNNNDVSCLTTTAATNDQNDRDNLQSEYNAKKMQFDNLVQKLDNDREKRRLKEAQKNDQQNIELMFSPDVAWRSAATQNNMSASSSVRSGQDPHSMPSSSNKPPHANSVAKGKDSTDSGAADVLGMSVDAGSLRSGSSRGFSVPPPMRNMARDPAPWRKTSQETSRISSINQANSNFENPHDGYPSSWYYHTNCFNNQGYSMSMARPQSPHCHYHHHMNGSDQHCCRPPPPPMYHPNVQPTLAAPIAAATNNNNDPMLLQQFIQTQQMLINSVCQCNQLLWDQQREINNLNSAVILLQERILNTSNNEVVSQSIRPESVPPNVTCTNTQSYLPRAQSEQPLNSHVGCYTNLASTGASNYGLSSQTQQQQQQQQTGAGRFAQYPFTCQNHSAQIYNRTPQQNNNISNVNRVMRLTNGNSVSQQQQQQQQQQLQQQIINKSDFYQNEIASGNAVYPNNFVNPPNIQMHHHIPPLSQSSNVSLNSVSSNINLLNNDTNNVQCQQPQSANSPPLSSSLYNINNNNNNNNNTVAASAAAAAAAIVAANNAVNASSNININQLHQQHQQQHHQQQQQLQHHQQHNAVAPLNNSVANNSAFSPPVPPALNNQVPPGNRANNYWDNFRSYSRQNLLSTNSCKSNEDAYIASNSPHNRDQTVRPTPLPSQMTHNILPATVSGTNKYSIHFRNQINQHSAAAAAAAAAQSTAGGTTTETAINSNATSTSIAPPDVLNVNQHHHNHSHLPMHHHQHAVGAVNNENMFGGGSAYINLNITPGNSNNQPTGNNNVCGQSSSTGNCNINLELNELRPGLSTKMQPKTTTGGNKRIRQLRERDQNILSANQQAAAGASGIDLNLASATVNRSDSKSSEKLFEALKENVYLEVSALITANESRPHFLINLFRELQLISTSDPLRNRLMQAFQELYNRYCEPTIQEENNSLLQSVENDVATPDTVQQDLTPQSSDNRYNHSTTSVDYPSADSTPVRVPDLHASIDEEILRSIMIEIAEFLISIEHINETVLQRITTIILRHINGPSTMMIGNKPQINLSKHYHLISHDELLRNLSQMDRRNRDYFMEGVETYLSSLISCSSSSSNNYNSNNNSNNTNHSNNDGTSSSTTPIATVVHHVQSNEIEDELYQQQRHSKKSMRRRQDNSFLDLTTPLSGCKSNEVLSVMRRCVDETITLADVAAVIGGGGGGGAENSRISLGEDNQDLAEADQICNATSSSGGGGGVNDDYSTEDDFNVTSNDMANECGAVGGVNISTLPDLAKVTATSSAALNEESAWMVNDEVERLTCQSNNLSIDGSTNNGNGNDSKQKNH